MARTKLRRKIEAIKRRSRIAGQVAALLGKSANEIAAMIRRPKIEEPAGATWAGYIAPKGEFLRSDEWKAMRRRVIEHYGPTCMSCGHAPSKRSRPNVDHIKPRKLFPELSLEFENLQVLCGRCNKDKGNRHMFDHRILPHKNCLASPPGR